MRPDPERAGRAIAGVARAGLLGVAVLLAVVLGAFLVGDNDAGLEAVLVVGALVLVAVLVGAAIVLEAHHRARPPE